MTDSSYALSVSRNGATLHVRGADYDEFYNNVAVVFGPDTDNILAAFTGVTLGATEAIANLQQGGLLSPPPPPSAPTGGGVSAPPAATGPAAPPPPTPPAPPQQQWGGQSDLPAGLAPDWKQRAPMCAHSQQHGPRNAREWTRGDGETSYTYFCSAPKGTPRDQQCQPIDAVTGKEWKRR